MKIILNTDICALNQKWTLKHEMLKGKCFENEKKERRNGEYIQALSSCS